MLGAARLLDRSGKAVGENNAVPRRTLRRERLEHNVVTALGVRCAVPRAVEGNESAIVVARGEARAGVDHDIVRRPVRWKCRNRRELAGTDADGLAAVAAILRREHQLVLDGVEVALGPAVVAAASDAQQLLRRLRGFFLRSVE